MRRLDEHPIDPPAAAALEAIDAALAGEPVDAEHAELAELALLLAAQRPEIGPAFASSLDERVQRRFAASSPATRRARWTLASAAGIALAAVLAVVVVLSSGGTRGPSRQEVAVSQSLRAHSAHAPASIPRAAPSAAAGAASTGLLQPPANGRKTIQGAQLALSAPPPRIDDVAQQVFDVIGTQHGIVERSTVTATGGPDGYADFDLSVPSASLPDTMARLSRLRYAQVSSRTDATRDVNSQFLDANRRLADARALRTSLLRQLANARTQQQIGSIQAQIRDAEVAIVRAQSDLRSLNHQVGYSQISLTIDARAGSVSHGGPFTIGRAAHDAGRVLTLAAGVVLIALAALLPVSLLGALAWWIANALGRRRREQALDAA